MNLFKLAWNYLKAKPLNTVLNIVLLSLGVGVITILLLFTKQFQDKIARNGKGIDLVVGAKGSPLQLILCNIYHVDFPTGNIKLKDAEKIAKNRLVKKAIPLALGDSFKGYRIIGTNKQYTEIYHCTLAKGKWWVKDMDVVVGSDVASFLKMNTGAEFISTHGLTDQGHQHDETDFKVVGILNSTGTITDNLIFTNVSSIWKVHNLYEEDDHGNTLSSTVQPSSLIPSIPAGDSVREITSMLIQYRSPMAAIQLPRLINANTNMQAASPAFETARLFSIMGVGVDILEGFAIILIFISALSIFIALFNSLRERKYDLAIMRTMGAGRIKLVVSVLLEGTLLAFAGVVVGMCAGHLALQSMSFSVEETQKAGITGFVIFAEEWWILSGGLVLGVLCSLLPAIQAYRTDISKVLAGN
jgi:putative ABC transport system permease protein